MPNNFRITGNVYVSKEGNDANSGLTPELPKLTVQAGLNTLAAGQTLVIGAGEYQEAIQRSFGFTCFIIGDGSVVISGNGTNYFSIEYVGNNFTTFTNIEFRNYISINCYGQNAYNAGVIFRSCIIKSNVNSGYTSNTCGRNEFYNCIHINNKLTQISVPGFGQPVGAGNGSPQGLVMNRCILINHSFELPYGISAISAPIQIINNYYDSTSTCYVPSATTAGNFNFNNIQGKIVMNTNGAVSGVNTNGVALSFAQHRIDYPTFNVNSISSNPLFNDPQNLNFTLQAGSPNIRGANDYISNIGGTEYAVYKSATSTEFTSGATISGLTLRGNNSYTITSSPTAGTIETAPISLQWPATKPLTKLEWAGVLEFNKSITAGTFGNNNVPDWDTYTSGAGASPDRLTVRMRYSTQQTQPTTSGQWDNGGYWTAGNYELFEVNSKPKVDSNGKGNGDPAYIESTGLGDIVPTWIQLSIKLIDTYNP